MRGHELHRTKGELHVLGGPVPGERDPHPARLRADDPGRDEAAEALRGLPGDAEQSVAVGAGAGATGPVLDPEEVVEQRRDEVVVQPVHVEGDDGQARRVERPVDPDSRVASQALHRRPGQRHVVLPDGGRPHVVLQREGQPGPDVAQDVGSPALLALGEPLHVVHLVVAAAGDVVHGAATGALGRAGVEEVAVGHQNARPLRPSQELVGRHEDGVEPLRRVGGVHVDGNVGSPGGVVDEGERALLVEHPGHRAHVGEETVDVGCGREGSGHERPPARGTGAAPQVVEVDVPAVVEGHLLHVGDALHPGQHVGVVLVGTDEDDRTPSRRDEGGEVVLPLERLGDAKPEEPHQLVHRGGGATAGEEDHVVLAGVHRARHGGAGLLAEAVHHPAGRGHGGMGVGVPGAQRVDEALDGLEVAAGGGEIGVVEEARPERGRDPRAPPPLRCPQRRGDTLEIGHGRVLLARPARGDKEHPFAPFPMGAEPVRTALRW